MTDDDTLEDERFAWTPSTILYKQIDRYLFLRSTGRGGAEALQGVLSMARSINDPEGLFSKDMVTIRDSGGSDWDVFEAVLKLLKRNNMWINPPRGLTPGRELLGAIK